MWRSFACRICSIETPKAHGKICRLTLKFCRYPCAVAKTAPSTTALSSGDFTHPPVPLLRKPMLRSFNVRPRLRPQPQQVLLQLPSISISPWTCGHLPWQVPTLPSTTMFSGSWLWCPRRRVTSYYVYSTSAGVRPKLKPFQRRKVKRDASCRAKAEPAAVTTRAETSEGGACAGCACHGENEASSLHDNWERLLSLLKSAAVVQSELPLL